MKLGNIKIGALCEIIAEAKKTGLNSLTFEDVDLINRPRIIALCKDVEITPIFTNSSEQKVAC